ncbi:MAG: NAD(+)/NADH kinase [Solirubrobacterales bacterium]|nr:NAD(+)/NADH kinase [Solirubrobacterales bacterium]
MNALASLERLADVRAPAGGAQRRRMLVIVNPRATTISGSDRLGGLVVAALRSRYDVEAVDTQRPGHATDLCREAAHAGYDVVVTVGGDGTVNEAANGLAGTATPLIPLPGGATNVLAKLLGIPGDMARATEHLLALRDAWTPRTIDLARVNGRWFTFSSGLGLDASAMRRADRHPRLKLRLRSAYFLASAVASFAREYLVRPPRMEVHAGGRTLPGVTVLVQNGEALTYFYDRPLHVADGAGLTTGTLAGAVLRRANPLDVPTVGARLFSRRRRVIDHPHIDGFSGVTTVRCVSTDGRAIPLEVDGDYLGDVTEAVFDVVPGALCVLG